MVDVISVHKSCEERFMILSYTAFLMIKNLLKLKNIVYIEILFKNSCLL